MDLYSEMNHLAKTAHNSSIIMAGSSPAAKNIFLKGLANLLSDRQKAILTANEQDLEIAFSAGLDKPRLDRLRLTPQIIDEMKRGCLHLAEMPELTGAMETQWIRPNGLLVGKMRIPLGVICMIYEARPNVTIDAAILCIKAGNAVILRGGKEALHSNICLADILREALCNANLPSTAAQLVTAASHEAVSILCKLDKYIDVVIPRGGENLIRAVCEAATMPVLKHYKGVCHCYVDKGANLTQACAIIENSKTQRPGVCNALECLLVHEDEADSFLPMLAQILAPHNVELRADPIALPLLGANAIPITENDKGHEFHDSILAVIVVQDMAAAIEYINQYGSHHTEIICSQNYDHCMCFLREVDASMVAVNASTRFNDGGQLGLGAEIGISTSKLHAYGPMGVKELTTTKFVVLGHGQIRE